MVYAPDKVKVARSGVLTDPIDIAGGTKALKGSLTYIRFNNDGTIEKENFPGFKNKCKKEVLIKILFYQMEGIIIVVGNSGWNITSEIITTITKTFRGIITTYALIKTIND